MAFDDRFCFSVHAAFVDDESSSVLLLRQSLWRSTMGTARGAVEPGETIVAALRRECREELGVEVEMGPLTGWYYHHEFRSQVGVLRCALPSGTAIRPSEEHSDLRWTPISELGGVQASRVQAAMDYEGTLHARVF